MHDHSSHYRHACLSAERRLVSYNTAPIELPKDLPVGKDDQENEQTIGSLEQDIKNNAQKLLDQHVDGINAELTGERQGFINLLQKMVNAYVALVRIPKEEERGMEGYNQYVNSVSTHVLHNKVFAAELAKLGWKSNIHSSMEDGIDENTGQPARMISFDNVDLSWSLPKPVREPRRDAPPLAARAAGEALPLPEVAEQAMTNALGRLSPSQLDPLTGVITWPQFVKQSDYDGPRGKIERAFAQRSSAGSLTDDEATAASKDIDDLLETSARDPFAGEAVSFLQRIFLSALSTIPSTFCLPEERKCQS